MCKSKEIIKVVDLGFCPLADTFLPEDLPNESEIWHPLNPALCRKCGHVFTLFSVSEEDRYKKMSIVMAPQIHLFLLHILKEFAESIIKETRLPTESLIVDFRSNVCTLLLYFKNLRHCLIYLKSHILYC